MNNVHFIPAFEDRNINHPYWRLLLESVKKILQTPSEGPSIILYVNFERSWTHEEDQNHTTKQLVECSFYKLGLAMVPIMLSERFKLADYEASNYFWQYLSALGRLGHVIVVFPKFFGTIVDKYGRSSFYYDIKNLYLDKIPAGGVLSVDLEKYYKQETYLKCSVDPRFQLFSKLPLKLRPTGYESPSPGGKQTAEVLWELQLQYLNTMLEKKTAAVRAVRQGILEEVKTLCLTYPKKEVAEAG